MGWRGEALQQDTDFYWQLCSLSACPWNQNFMNDSVVGWASCPGCNVHTMAGPSMGEASCKLRMRLVLRQSKVKYGQGGTFLEDMLFHRFEAGIHHTTSYNYTTQPLTSFDYIPLCAAGRCTKIPQADSEKVLAESPRACLSILPTEERTGCIF